MGKTRKAPVIASAAAVLCMLLMAGCWRTDIDGRQAAVIGMGVFAAGSAGALALALCMRRAIRRRWKPENLFALLFVPLSLGMMIALPIFRAPDEPAHLQRIWQISIGEWLPNEENQGVFYEPENFLQGARDETKTTLYNVFGNRNSDMSMDALVVSGVAANTGFYPVNNYFPQALGMAFARLFTLNRMAIFYAARLFAWLVTFALFYYAVRRAPAGKYMIIALSLLPMMLQEAASASADGMTCAANAAYLALIASLIAQPRRISLREGALLFVLMGMVGTFKMLYCPMALLCLFIPAQCFGGKRRKGAVLGAMLAAVFAFALLWVLFCNRSYVSAEAAEGGHILSQLGWMLRNPLGFLEVLGRTLLTQFGTYVEWFVGTSLSWMNVQLPALLFWLLLGGLCMTAAQDGGMGRRMLGARRGALALAGLSTAIIFIALYVWQTPYAGDTIIGVQGRYFLPIAPAVYMALRKPREDTQAAAKAVCAIALLDVCALAFVIVQTAV